MVKIYSIKLWTVKNMHPSTTLLLPWTSLHLPSGFENKLDINNAEQCVFAVSQIGVTLLHPQSKQVCRKFLSLPLIHEVSAITVLTPAWQTNLASKSILVKLVFNQL